MKRRVIVTFKKKDTRANPEPDKLELLAEAVGEELPSPGRATDRCPAGSTSTMSSTTLTSTRRRSWWPPSTTIRSKRYGGAEDVATVEEDGPMFALGRLVIEGQPSVLEETVPAGDRSDQGTRRLGRFEGEGDEGGGARHRDRPRPSRPGGQSADGDELCQHRDQHRRLQRARDPCGRDRRRRPRPDRRGRGGPGGCALPGQGARPQRAGAVEQPDRRDRLVHQLPRTSASST